MKPDEGGVRVECWIRPVSCCVMLLVAAFAVAGRSAQSSLLKFSASTLAAAELSRPVEADGGAYNRQRRQSSKLGVEEQLTFAF